MSLAFALPLFASSPDVLIDNPKVRVLRVVVEPGQQAANEAPELDRVVIWLKGGSAERRSPGGKSEDISWKQYDANWEPAGSSQTLRLKGKEPVTAIIVELKGKGDAQRAATSPLNPWIVDSRHYKIEFENSVVRVTRVNIGPKESTPLHEHSLDRVVTYLTALNFQIDPEGKPSQHSVLPAGAVAWGTPVRHTEHNLSNEKFEAVVVEPKY